MIEQCTCGCVHVTIGAVTLRLAQSAIEPLAQTLNEALVKLTVAHTRWLPLEALS